MTDKQDSPSLLSHILHFTQTFFLETCVADGKDFIKNENFRLQMGGDTEGETDIHAGRVPFYRSVYEVFDLGEVNNLVEFLPDFLLAHPQDRAVEKNVFPTGQLRVKPGSHLQKACYPPPDLDIPPGWRRDLGEDLEKCGLSRAVTADDAENITLLDFKGDIFQRPEAVGSR